MNRLLSLALACVTLATGCELYSSGDDCVAVPQGALFLIQDRNPDTGQCESQGGGGGGGSCGAGFDIPPPPDWAVCNGTCETLAEADCLTTPDCRAAYVSDCPEGTPCFTENFTFFQCWGVAPSGPIEGGGCAGLDAQTCSEHDDCVAQHYATTTPGIDQARVGNFERCADEPIGCYGSDTCGSGTHCSVDDGTCLSPPGCNTQGANPKACPAVCYGFCVPDQPVAGHCYGAVACDALPPTCPDGTRPGIDGACWSGQCIPIAECPEGTCYGQVLCDSPEPVCQAGSVPGVANGCYTGSCIATAECPDQPDCSALDEATCIARTDCAPTYQGSGCTCTADACTCTTWSFVSCEARPALDPP